MGSLSRFRGAIRCVQVGDGQAAATSGSGIDQSIPSSIRNSPSLLPSIDRVWLLIQGGRHGAEIGPNRKYVVKGLHPFPYIPDYLSAQGRIEKQVTPLFPHLTMQSMYSPRKASTPATWRKEFIARVKAARIASKKKPIEVAAELVVTLDTYNRWENRSLMPHHLIVPFCRVTGADPIELMTGIPFDLGRALGQSGR